MRHAGVETQVGEGESRHWECVVSVACAGTGLLNVEPDMCMPVKETTLAQRMGPEIARFCSCSMTARRVAPSHPSCTRMRDRLAGGRACRMQRAEGGSLGRRRAKPLDEGVAARKRYSSLLGLCLPWWMSEMGAREVRGGFMFASRRARPRKSGDHGDISRSGDSG